MPYSFYRYGIFQELFKIILVPIYHPDVHLIRKDFYSLKSFPIFGIGMDIGIKEESPDFHPAFKDFFQGVDCTWTAADVDE